MLNHKGTDAPGHSGQLRLDFFRPLVTNNSTKDQSSSLAIKDVYNNTAGSFRDVKRTWQGVFVPIGLRRITATMCDVLTGN